MPFRQAAQSRGQAARQFFADRHTRFQMQRLHFKHSLGAVSFGIQPANQPPAVEDG